MRAGHLQAKARLGHLLQAEHGGSGVERACALAGTEVCRYKCRFAE